MNRLIRGLIGQRGQALVIGALVAVVLFGMAALAVDIGIAQAERRDVQAAVDEATLAGTRQYSQPTNNDLRAAHFVALQYIANALKLSLSSVNPGCTSIASANCTATSFTIGGYTFNFLDGTNEMDMTASHLRSTLLAGAIGITQETIGTSARALAPGPITVGAGYSVFAFGGSFLIHGGGTSNPSGNVTGGVYANGSAGANNGPHAINIPTQPTDANGNVCNPSSTTKVDITDPSNAYNYTPQQTPPGTGPTNVAASTGIPPKPDPFAGFPAPTTTGPTFNTTGAAQSGGVWQPGTYNGISPNGGTMAPGVYVIQNYAGTIAPGKNNIGANGAASGGQFNKLGAIALVIDSSDTGTLSLNNPTDINGLDDDGTNPRDPQGTHNFVVYGPTFTGGTSFGSGNVGPSYISGIVDVPNSSARSNGNVKYNFYGEIVFHDYTLNGGGNSVQQFNFVCNLSAFSAAGARNGLIR